MAYNVPDPVCDLVQLVELLFAPRLVNRVDKRDGRSQGHHNRGDGHGKRTGKYAGDGTNQKCENRRVQPGLNHAVRKAYALTQIDLSATLVGADRDFGTYSRQTDMPPLEVSAHFRSGTLPVAAHVCHFHGRVINLSQLENDLIPLFIAQIPGDQPLGIYVS